MESVTFEMGAGYVGVRFDFKGNMKFNNMEELKPSLPSLSPLLANVSSQSLDTVRV